MSGLKWKEKEGNLITEGLLKLANSKESSKILKDSSSFKLLQKDEDTWDADVEMEK